MQYDKLEELDWLAFRYIAGELSASEADAFETRMADDQQAREAVARAVGLAFTLAAAGPRTPEPCPADARTAEAGRHGRMARLAAWLTVAAAACLAGVWAYQSFQGSASQPGSRRQVAGEEEAAVLENPRQQLALLWSRTREELAVLYDDDRVFDSADLMESFEAAAWSSIEDPFEPDLATPDDLLAANDPPTWMLAAVRARLGEAETESHGPSLSQEN